MKLSIITPSYNQGPFVERTLQSVLSQEAVDFEYVVFDGGSTDETVGIVRQYGERYRDRMRWVSEKDRGQAHAINKGIAATTGEIIGWINSDDVYYPGALRAVEQFFAAHPDVDVAYGAADHIDALGSFMSAYPTEPWDFQRMLATCIICQPAAFFRRRVVDRYGLLDERLHYCMDYDYWIRIGFAGGRFRLMPERLAGSRMYPQNKTLGSRVAVHAEINDMFKRQFGYVPERWIHNYAHIVTEQRVARKASRRFRLEFGLRVMIASLRWNRSLQPRAAPIRCD